MKSPLRLINYTHLMFATVLLLGMFVDRNLSAPTVDEEEGEGGCYYMFNHYGEGDRILTNEPCLNCTCHNAMLMCYLRVCPFTKPIGQDCTIEKKPDQCCPVITCPQVPVSLVTPGAMVSTTTSTTTLATISPSEVALSERGCELDGKYYPDGAQVASDPNKPCELCYCIRNKTACVMQECTLRVDGCVPVLQQGVCCPVRYQCDSPLQITDSSTVAGIITTTVNSIFQSTSMPGGCYKDGEYYADGSQIPNVGEAPCEHCYCMRGEIVCAVQECGSPLENEGGNCTAVPPRSGLCCPEKYTCVPDEVAPVDTITTSMQSVHATSSKPELSSEQPLSPVDATEETKSEVVTTLPLKEPSAIEDVVEITSQAPGSTSRPVIVDENDNVVHDSTNEEDTIQTTVRTPEPVQSSSSASVSEQPETASPDFSEVTTVKIPMEKHPEEVKLADVDIVKTKDHETTVKPEASAEDEQIVVTEISSRPVSSGHPMVIGEEVQLPSQPESMNLEAGSVPETSVEPNKPLDAVPTVAADANAGTLESDTLRPQSPDRESTATGKAPQASEDVEMTEAVNKEPLDIGTSVKSSTEPDPETNEIGDKGQVVETTVSPIQLSSNQADAAAVDVVMETTTNVPSISSSEPNVVSTSTRTQDSEKEDLAATTARPSIIEFDEKPGDDDVVSSVDEVTTVVPEKKPVYPSIVTSVPVVWTTEEANVPTTTSASAPIPEKAPVKTEDVVMEENMVPESTFTTEYPKPSVLKERVTVSSVQTETTVSPVGVEEQDDGQGTVHDDTPSTIPPKQTPVSVKDEVVVTSSPVVDEIQVIGEEVSTPKMPTIMNIEKEPSSVPQEAVDESLADDGVETVTVNAEEKTTVKVIKTSEDIGTVETTTIVSSDAVNVVSESSSSAPVPAKVVDEVTTQVVTDFGSEDTDVEKVSEVKGGEEKNDEPIISTTVRPSVVSEPGDDASQKPIVESVTDKVLIVPSSQDDFVILPSVTTAAPIIIDADVKSQPQVTVVPPEVDVTMKVDTVDVIQTETEKSPVSEQGQDETIIMDGVQNVVDFTTVPPTSVPVVVASSSAVPSEKTEAPVEIIVEDVKSKPSMESVDLVKGTETSYTTQTPTAIGDSDDSPVSPVKTEEAQLSFDEKVDQVKVTDVPASEVAPTVIPEQATIKHQLVAIVESVTMTPSDIPTTNSPSIIEPQEVSTTVKASVEPVSSVGQSDSSSKDSENVNQASVEPEVVVTTSQPVVSEAPEDLKVDDDSIEDAAPSVSSMVRIPGEGSCFVEGKTYANGTRIPPSTPCQLACACQNSIVHCLLVHCKPPPYNFFGCVPVYKQGICCPEYNCDSPSTTSVTVTAVPETEKTSSTTEGSVVTVTPESVSSENTNFAEAQAMKDNPDRVDEGVTTSAQPQMVESSSVAPVVSTVKLTVEQEDPTSAPVQDNDAPQLDDSSEQEVTSHAPVAATSESAPVASTSAPVTSTSEPIASTSEPIASTSTPAPEVSSPPELNEVIPPKSQGTADEMSVVIPPKSQETGDEMSVVIPPKSQESAEEPPVVSPPKLQESVDEMPVVSPSQENLDSQEGTMAAPVEDIMTGIIGSNNTVESSTDVPDDASVEGGTSSSLSPGSHYPVTTTTTVTPSAAPWPYPTSTPASVMSSGACLFDGRVYMSAQQIPRDDPCDFCFCFRGDIICLQQSCPPPIPGCYEEPIPGFCCPRYECPVGSGNITTQPPLFPPSYYHNQILSNAVQGGSSGNNVIPSNIASGPGCEIQGEYYETGQIIVSTSGPCLECRCGATGMMECDPRECQPEPMLRKMIAAITS